MVMSCSSPNYSACALQKRSSLTRAKLQRMIKSPTPSPSAKFFHDPTSSHDVRKHQSKNDKRVN